MITDIRWYLWIDWHDWDNYIKNDLYSNNQQVITILEETTKTYKYSICKIHVNFKAAQVIDYMLEEVITCIVCVYFDKY